MVEGEKFFPVRDVEKLIFARLEMSEVVALAAVSPYCFHLISSRPHYALIKEKILTQLIRSWQKRKPYPLQPIRATERLILNQLNPHQLSQLAKMTTHGYRFVCHHSQYPLLRELLLIDRLCRLTIRGYPLSPPTPLFLPPLKMEFERACSLPILRHRLLSASRYFPIWASKGANGKTNLPAEYFPILPLHMITGHHGIGSGYGGYPSSLHNPLDLIVWFKQLCLREGKFVQLVDGQMINLYFEDW